MSEATCSSDFSILTIQYCLAVYYMQNVWCNINTKYCFFTFLFLYCTIISIWCEWDCHNIIKYAYFVSIALNRWIALNVNCIIIQRTNRFVVHDKSLHQMSFSCKFRMIYSAQQIAGNTTNYTWRHIHFSTL